MNAGEQTSRHLLLAVITTVFSTLMSLVTLVMSWEEAVKKITGRLGANSFMRSKVSMPFSFGISISKRTRSTGSPLILSRAFWLLHIARIGSDTLYENLCVGLLLIEFFYLPLILSRALMPESAKSTS